MGHRTQITLTDAQYALLKQESARSGASLSELIRQAVDRVYARRHHSRDEVERALDATFGMWSDRGIDDPVAWVKQIRGPGLGRRLFGSEPDA